ncbi:suppressor protein stp22 of temperature-sensitive alpha-factor receptor and arginine permease [Tieghemiomyces parasiticus]|uniref:Suppressor protein stp22 of temperature-sensitive alpha-factor receptor and arginine permease n=1 Tax=Tieghemiomyces parasiticus TaxID=78921 RepID=A0A9W8A7C8_9FUNG|nr:suppressor protein stp22 of temperature-sensitive alpha-factor receptor and arginine permease [Tieghemiomyces parasiticus]
MDHSTLRPWLTAVTKGHVDPVTTTQHVVDILAQFPTLRPKYDYYTLPQANQREPTLSTFGTLPVTFQGHVYQFPIAVYFPVRYPQVPPVAEVTPTADMVIVPGKCVDDRGFIHHPYLTQWEHQASGHPYSAAELLRALQPVFSQEPPVGMRRKPLQNPSASLSSPDLLQGSSATLGPAAPGSSAYPMPRPPFSASASHLSDSALPAQSAYSSSLPSQALSNMHPPPPPQAQPSTTSRPASTTLYPASYSQAPSVAATVAHSHHQYPSASQETPTSWTPADTAPPASQTAPPPAHSAPPPATSEAPAQSNYYTSPPQLNPPPSQPLPSLPAVTQAPPPAALPAGAASTDTLNLADLRQQLSLIDSDPVGPEQKLAGFQLAVYDKLSGALERFNKDMKHRTTHLLAINQHLNHGEEIVEKERRLLTAMKRKIENNVGVLESKHQELVAQQERIDQIQPRMAAEVFRGRQPAHEQLFQLVAEENALEDTIYYLGKALSLSRIDLPVYLRSVRSLAHDQFICRAHIQKVRRACGLPAAP